MNTMEAPIGKILLLGSGETSSYGKRAFEEIIKDIPSPVRFALLECPAGFELNSASVIRNVGDFILARLQNHDPAVEFIPTLGRCYPDEHPVRENLMPLLKSQVIFLGPGSPSYTINALKDSLTWETLCYAVQRGANLVLASAAVTAFGKLGLPVYEIYKAGRDPFWLPGLNFFGQYNLDLVLIPHWNNQDGGPGLDTSSCFIGKQRMDPMIDALSGSIKVLGIDELTGCIVDFKQRTCRVIGQSQVHLRSDGKSRDFNSGQDFPLELLGQFEFHESSQPGANLEWLITESRQNITVLQSETPPSELMDMINERENARRNGQWERADEIRLEVRSKGWTITDTSTGPTIQRVR